MLTIVSICVMIIGLAMVVISLVQTKVEKMSIGAKITKTHWIPGHKNIASDTLKIDLNMKTIGDHVTNKLHILFDIDGEKHWGRVWNTIEFGEEYDIWVMIPFPSIENRKPPKQVTTLDWTTL